MSTSPSFRWLWTGMTMLGCAVAALIASAVTGMSHGPNLAVVTFLVAVPVLGVTGLVLTAIAARKGQAENRQLAAQADAEVRAARGHPRRNGGRG
jgi:Flp pilus assembly protein TadB